MSTKGYSQNQRLCQLVVVDHTEIAQQTRTQKHRNTTALTLNWNLLFKFQLPVSAVVCLFSSRVHVCYCANSRYSHPTWCFGTNTVSSVLHMLFWMGNFLKGRSASTAHLKHEARRNHISNFIQNTKCKNDFAARHLGNCVLSYIQELLNGSNDRNKCNT